MTTSMLFISLFFFLSLPSVLPLSDLEKLYLPSNTTGPEALAFDPAGAGPYTVVSDGRILKYVNPTDGFQDFAVTSPTRPKQLCDGSTVGPNGGTAAQLVTSAEGVPFRFLNGLDIDQETGIVYFTDASARFQRNQFSQAILSGDRTGRLLKYDPVSKVVTVLQRNLGLPVGVAVSKDGQFWSTRQHFWQEHKDNIKRSAKGEFWVPIYTGAASLGVRLSENGRLLQILKLSALNPVQQYSEVHEYQGKIYLGSVTAINTLEFSIDRV
ncbi:hypothetical protein Patl1_19005 [Pistacia atlantica]|uniref:Uncharacterized protein n=1 Tax=Pistacia atlantica TaxID=434234 RepID=A0ACC1BYI7_9ROSI|nr:hypothetical protein Patl1_19005 [Pistacia atlantica]